MPLIQSEVNAEMRDLQMDSQLFMAPSVNSSSVPKSGDDVRILFFHSILAILFFFPFFRLMFLKQQKDVLQLFNHYSHIGLNYHNIVIKYYIFTLN